MLRSPISIRVPASLGALALLIIAGLSAGSASAQPSPVVYASARGESFTSEDWEALLERAPHFAERKYETRAQAENFVRNQVFSRLKLDIVLARIEREGLADTPDGIAVAQCAGNLGTSAWVRERVSSRLIEVTESEIEAAIRDHPDLARQPDQLVFHHIFMATDGIDDGKREEKAASAEAIVSQTRSADDPLATFKMLIEEYSEAEIESRMNTVGPISPDRFGSSLVDPLWQLDTGQASDVIASGKGLHIFFVLARIPDPRSGSQIAKAIRARAAADKFGSWMLRLRQDALDKYGLALPAASGAARADEIIIAGAAALDVRQLALARGAETFDPRVARQLHQFIPLVQDAYLLAAFARERGWAEDEGFVAARALPARVALLHLFWTRLAGEEILVNQAEIEEAYRATADRMALPERLEVRELELRPERGAASVGAIDLAEVLINADLIRRRWSEGAEFIDLVREHSTSAEAEQGGTVYWLSQSDADAVRFKAVSGLSPGDVSHPIGLADGYLLLQVVQAERNLPIPIARVAADIHLRLNDQKRQAFYGRWDRALQVDMTWSIPESIVLQHTRSAD